MFVVLGIGAASCEDGTENESFGVFLQQEAPGENCEHGGVRTEPAVGDPVYVCESADGLTAAVAEVPPGEACPTGGVEVHYAGSVLTVCHGESGAVTVTPVSSGPSCPSGGLLVTDAGGTSTVCSETAVQLALEAPGNHCAAGGIAVTDASGGTWYVCHGEDGEVLGTAMGGLCPGGTLEKYDPAEAIYAVVEGSLRGVFPGGATTPDGTTGAIAVVATCHGVYSPTDPATGLVTGRNQMEPYYLIFRVDPALPFLLEAMSINNAVQVAVRVFSGTAPTLSVDLEDGRIISVEQVTLADHLRPGAYTEYLRVGIGYSRFMLTHEASGETFLAEGVGSVDGPSFDDDYAPETDRCVVSRGAYPLKFLSLTGTYQGEIGGGATHPSEAGAIEVFSACQAAFSPGFPLASGRYTMRELILTKAVDEASPRLMSALFGVERLTGSLRFYRLGDLGLEEQYATITLIGARVVDLEQVIQGGSRFERATLVFESLSYIWEDSGDTALLRWTGVDPG